MAYGVGSSIFGAAKQRRSARRQRRILRDAAADEASWYNREYYTDELDRSSAKRMLRRVEDTLTNRANASRGAAAVSGATQGAVLGEQENAQRVISDTMSGIAAQESDRRSNVDAIHQRNLSNLAQGNAEIETANQAGGAQLAANGAQLISSGASMALGDYDDWRKNAGQSPNGVK